MTGFFRTITLTACLFTGFLPRAWAGGTPYGANGLGVFIEDNVGRTQGMGGAGVAVSDGMVMIRSNPALLADFERPVYGIGIQLDRRSTFTETAGTITYARTNPSLVRFVLPFRGKFSLGWGLSPYTRADAKLKINPKPGDIFTDTMTSSGGINVTSFDLATKYRMISVGASLNYYFGSATEMWQRDFHGADGMENASENLRKQYGGYGMTLGILARLPWNTSVGMGYSPSTDMDVSLRVRPGSSSNPERLVGKMPLELPSNLRVGVASQFSRRLSAAADFSFAGWTDVAKDEEDREMYTDTYTFGAGVRYIPSTSISAPYLSTIPLSAGFRVGNMYYKSYPKVNTIREAAITLGAELPFRNNSGGLMTSCEIGKRGDKDKNGWDEMFINVGLTLVGGIK